MYFLIKEHGMSKYLIVNGSVYFGDESAEVKAQKLESLLNKVNEEFCMSDSELDAEPTDDVNVFDLHGHGDVSTSLEESDFLKKVCKELGIFAVFRLSGDDYNPETFIWCGPDEEKAKDLMRREVVEFYISKISSEGEFDTYNEAVNYMQSIY